MSKRRPIGPWIIAAVIAVIGLFVGYALSVGPVMRLSIDVDLPDWLSAALDAYLAPFGFFIDHAPDSVKDPYFDYVNWWLPYDGLM